MLLPWPTRTQRRAAIASAEREKHQSRASAERAAAIGAAIEHMRHENHFADSIRASLIQGHHNGGRE